MGSPAEAPCPPKWLPALMPRSWCTHPVACTWCLSIVPWADRSAWKSLSGSWITSACPVCSEMLSLTFLPEITTATTAGKWFCTKSCSQKVACGLPGPVCSAPASWYRPRRPSSLTSSSSCCSASGAIFLVTFRNSDKSETMVCRLPKNQRYLLLDGDSCQEVTHIYAVQVLTEGFPATAGGGPSGPPACPCSLSTRAEGRTQPKLTARENAPASMKQCTGWLAALHKASKLLYKSQDK